MRRVWPLITSGTGLPFRVLIRRQLSIRFDVAPVPVYVAQSNEHLGNGWDLFSDAMKVLQLHGSLWLQRMPRLVKRMMLLDTVDTSAFYLADRCCCINPWNVRRHVRDTSAAAIVLAGLMVHSLCAAHLLSKRRPYSARTRRRLALKANIRFLNRCLNESWHIEVEAAMNALSSYCDQ